MKLPGPLLSTSSKKYEKIHPEKISLYFKKSNFIALRLKKKFISSQKKAFLIFQETKLSYILEYRTF